MRSPATPVLMITIDDTEQSVRLALAAGARGYIVKSEAGEHLKAAVLALAQTDDKGKSLPGTTVVPPLSTLSGSSRGA
jgi:DNA-binding NarL/FixJ family response regulator